MISPELTAQCKKMMVEEGKDPLTIVSQTGVSRVELGFAINEGKWRTLREEFLQKESAKSTSATPDDHAYVADELVMIGREIARSLKDAADPASIRALRSRAEAFRTTVEATDRAVRLARDSRGLRIGQPSKINDSEGTTTVYNVVKVVRSEENGQVLKHAQ